MGGLTGSYSAIEYLQWQAMILSKKNLSVVYWNVPTSTNCEALCNFFFC